MPQSRMNDRPHSSLLPHQTRKMVFAKHEQTGISLEKVVESLQKDFEQAMEAVVYQIRKNHGEHIGDR